MLACLGTLAQLGYSVSNQMKAGFRDSPNPRFQREMPVFGIVQDYPILGIIVCMVLFLCGMTTYFRAGRNYA